MAGRSSTNDSLTHLSAVRAGSDELNVIIETPKGSRNKFDYDEEYGLFKLGGVLAAGAVFRTISASFRPPSAVTAIRSTCSSSWTSRPSPAVSSPPA